MRGQGGWGTGPGGIEERWEGGRREGEGEREGGGGGGRGREGEGGEGRRGDKKMGRFGLL